MCLVQAGPQGGKRQGPGETWRRRGGSPWGHGEEKDRALVSEDWVILVC